MSGVLHVWATRPTGAASSRGPAPRVSKGRGGAPRFLRSLDPHMEGMMRGLQLPTPTPHPLTCALHHPNLPVLLQPMAPIEGVTQLQGDITSEATALQV